ncbi:wax ester/triacylglycerol synthase family O-acyltransferase [Sinimarinibacterium sp. CAU 1509]|uniref:WS/DGAT/MGAT family O-acyltransferase n=1 Tax=Sinimarinibacterium sp. CAU 1509 TaxID=2562283 RepID=UPI0010ACB044|nr:wax ester/triacylglycerol synthase family O-acyltransferase [Sinimarinibacterium sp. CAU 1509]TJY62049.1 wax ester/triacylglycerol synthase family O-acyltransferase [Sinimarinibacterium sp. CAU 1509]
MLRLSPIDAAFLLVEQRHMPLHVGGLVLFEPPEGAPPDFAAQIAAHLRESTGVVPPFDRHPNTRFGFRFWDSEREFDLGQHFVHLALPKPGRIRELLAMVSRVHSAHLDRAYPLWRMYLVEGLEDGRIALYFKIHHAVVDGIAALRLFMKSMSNDRESSMRMAAPWEIPSRRSGTTLAVPAPAALGPVGLIASLARNGVRATPTFVKQLQHTWHDYRAHNPYLATSVQAPRCILNQMVTASRRFAAQSYPTDRIRAVADAVHGTLNDVILALCAGALRRYLTDLDALPDEPLVSIVPVSVRRDDGDSGNEIAFALANLATHLSDPVERLLLIKGCMDYNKARFREMSPAQLQAFSVAQLLPGALMWLSRLDPKHFIANLVISHVPGPREPMYWQGCRLDGMYPASLVVDTMALNITIISRGDAVDFGLIACRRAVPRVQRMLDYIATSLDELEDALL